MPLLYIYNGQCGDGGIHHFNVVHHSSNVRNHLKVVSYHAHVQAVMTTHAHTCNLFDLVEGLIIRHHPLPFVHFHHAYLNIMIKLPSITLINCMVVFYFIFSV